MAQNAAVRPRQSGGFNQGFGDFSDEHLDENALQQAAAQQQLAQQGSNPGTTTGTQHIPPGQEPAKPQPKQDLGSLWDELLAEPSREFSTQLTSLVDFREFLGLNPQPKTPEEEAKLKATHQRYQQLNEEQQRFAQKQYQEKLKKKQLEEEETARQEQAKKEAAAAAVVMPSSPKKGPVGPGGTGKQRAVTQLEQDRKTLNGPANVG